MSQTMLSRLQAARDRACAQAEQICLTVKESGRDTLNELEQRAFDEHHADIVALNQRITEAEEDLARSRIPASLSELVNENMGPRRTSSSRV